MLEKVKEVLDKGTSKKVKDTSRINLDNELDEVRAKIDADNAMREAQKRKAMKATNGAA